MPNKKLVGRNYRTGLQKNREPFIIEDDAFVELFNAYVWRGRIKKKLGVVNLGRLRRDFVAYSLGLSGASPWTFNVFTVATPIGAGEANKTLVPGTLIITIAGPIVFTDQGDGTLTSVTPGNSGTVNYATASVTLTHTAGAGAATTANISYYPGLPVMGLPSRVLSGINEKQLIAFDTKYAYQYGNVINRFEQTPSTLAVTWSGTDSQLFWAENAYEALWVTNGVAGLHGYSVTLFAAAAAGPPSTVNVTAAGNTFQVGDTVYFLNLAGAGAANNLKWGTVTVAGNPFTISNPATGYFANGVVTGVVLSPNVSTNGDGIRWYDGTSWHNFNPPINGINALMGGGIIVFYRGRIVVLDTLEGNSLTPSATRYPQRARWSQNGTPFYVAPVPTAANIGVEIEAWNETIVGRGGYIDCPTTEQIVGACFLRDTLIVAFEDSTWKLRYTNNELLPFVWERLDVELGCKGRFSGVRFDKVVLFVGSRGIIACDGVGVNRVDLLIPDIVFNFNNDNSGPERISGIRDFEEQIVYWTFPNDSEITGQVFPNRILLYNYLDESFAQLLDTFTTYGYWSGFDDLTWAQASRPWEEYSRTWSGTGSNAKEPQVVSGNQQGFVQRVQQQVGNDATLQVTAVTVAANVPTELTIPNHNLPQQSIIQLSGFLALNAGLNGLVLQAKYKDTNTVQLYVYDPITDTYGEFTGGSSTYIGGGLVSRVDNFQILTKKFNPFLDDAVSARLKQTDFYVSGTSQGRFMVNIYINDLNDTPANDTPSGNALSNRVETFANPYEPAGQDKYWHTLFDTATGNLFQIEILYGNQEMNDSGIFNSEVTIHSIAPQADVASQRLT